MTIAFWCVLIGAILPYVPFGLIKGLNPRLPRMGVSDLQGLSARAHGAHLNAFESFPAFAAAVIVSHLVQGGSTFANVAALLYIVARIGHMAFYLMDKQPLRSACFGIGGLLILAIFIQPAFH